LFWSSIFAKIMADKKDFYQILGVSKGASDTDIKKAYRVLARKHHPDVDKSEGAHERFKEINEAYQVLSDPKKRQAYDQFGHSAFEQGSPFGAGAQNGWQQGPGGYTYRTYTSGGQPFEGFDFGGFSDPFDIFEMMFGGSSPFGRQSRAPRYGLQLSFEEAVRGATKEVEMDGKRMKIKIPAGVDDDSEIKFGDVYIVCQVKGDPHFTRQGYDIFTNVDVSFAKAAIGGTIEVLTIDGKVKVRLSSGTQSGTQIRLRGKGVPRLRGGGRGDHYINILVRVPTKLSREEKRLLEELEEIQERT